MAALGGLVHRDGCRPKATAVGYATLDLTPRSAVRSRAAAARTR
jgi:hypothetical protein